MPDIVTSKTFVDGEKGITATKMNQIIGGAVIQPSFFSSKPSSPTLDPTDVLLELKGTGAYAQITGSQIASSVAGLLPLADTTQNGMLRQVSGLTTDVVDGTNNCVPLASFAGITQMRLRSFNAVGNPTFEVDQRYAGAALTNPTGFIQDRWATVKSALTGTVNTFLGDASGGPIVIPGTNFGITQRFQRFTVGTSQPTLAAADYYLLAQALEGPRWRELASDVHSFSILVRSSVANLAFSVSLVDAAGTHSLVRLCTIPTANTWTLLTLPNLPVWVGTYNAAPGQTAYGLYVTLACGTDNSRPSSSVWQTGRVFGIDGMSNFLSISGATFDIAFVQHEPGALCTTPIDCPFNQNYDDCLRYFFKTNDYANVPGTLGGPGALGSAWSTSLFISAGSYAKPLAKTPTIKIWDTSGNLGFVTTPPGSIGGAAAAIVGTSKFQNINVTTNAGITIGMPCAFQYSADTGL